MFSRASHSTLTILEQVHGVFRACGGARAACGDLALCAGSAQVTITSHGWSGGTRKLASFLGYNASEVLPKQARSIPSRNNNQSNHNFSTLRQSRSATKTTVARVHSLDTSA
jgi:hypothetical protein